MKYFDLMSNFYFDLDISIFYFAVFFFFLLLILSYKRLKIQKGNKRFLRKSYIKKLTYLLKRFSNGNRTYSSKSIWIFFGLFIWLTQNFICNNFKTSQVLVDTSELVKDGNDLLIRKSVVCSLKSSVLSLYENAPKNSFLEKIYNGNTMLKDDQTAEKKILESDHCLFSKFFSENLKYN